MPALVLTRSEEDNQDLVDDYACTGIEFYSFPCLEFASPVDNYNALDQAIRNNHNYDWLFFLSKKSVEIFFERLLALGGQFFHLSPRLKIACVGQSTKNFITEQISFPVDFVPTQFTAEALLEQFLEHYATEGFISGMDTKKILLPRNEDIEDELTELLVNQKEFELNICPAYRTIGAKHSQESIENLKQILAKHSEIFISFGSSKTVENFAKYISEADLHSGVKFISIGPKTSATIKHLFPNKLLIEARKASFEAIMSELSVLKS